MTGSVLTHSVRILGRDLQVKSTATQEQVAEVEALVNAKLVEADAAVSGGDTQLVVILAMMNMAEAFLAARREAEEQKRSLGERVASLLARIDVQVG